MSDIVAVYEWYCEGSAPGDHEIREVDWPDGPPGSPLVRSCGEDTDEHGGVRMLFNGQSPVCTTCGGALRRRPVDMTFPVPV